jgi:hypothetical protein
MTLQLGDVKNSLIEIENKTSDIALEFIKIKEHASDLQTFLILPLLSIGLVVSGPTICACFSFSLT